MSGPIRFVYMIIWIAIGMSTLGTLRDCTRVMAGLANESQQNEFSLGKWNRLLTGTK